ncbi:TRAP transporter substrate-binding protein [Paracoccus onubensis]|uniref:TRAP transporter substrate-binding protein n=1 Tax=Paracoccus onubensis TaxID=1675788 RepID=UPI0027300BA7|nr:TRAP transporter substrate-binding protein [Paracoccus onubensis]MDP0929443.1 TRAP transporter substrate-binding protein [Paracoccus onubensis]
MKRRQFIGASTAALAVPALFRPGRAMAAEFTYKFANNFPLGHPMNNRMEEARDRIAEETDGRFALKIFPNNQLGSDTDTLNQVRSGAVEFFTLSGIILSSLVPVASINGMGFAFKDTSEVWQAMDGELGAYVRKQIKGARLHVMDKIFNNGFRQITTSTGPIEGPDDLDGLKIRVPVSPLWTSMFQALGCAPASINWNEVYPALQTGIVDAQENPLSTIDVGKLFEVQKYCSLTNHMWDGFWMLANQRSWDRLPDDVKEIVSRNINQAATDQRQDIDDLNANLRNALEEHGMVFNKPDTEAIRGQLREAKFYAEWRQNYGDEAWSLLEQVTGSLA